MTNYILKVKTVINDPLKLITGSYTFTDPTVFTVYLPAYSYNDINEALSENDLVLIRNQKNSSFNALAFWGGQYDDNGNKILYAETLSMAAAMLTIINGDHVYIRYQRNKNCNSKYYKFAYELTRKELRFFFEERPRPNNCERLDENMIDEEILDDFDDFISQIRIANFIYCDLRRTLCKTPNKLLTAVIEENKLLQQQLGTVDSVSCNNFRCSRKRPYNNK